MKIADLRIKKPLVHCITNYVTVNDVANAILAIGASPIMADDIGEAADIASMSDALVINIGTLNARTIESMLAAGDAANRKGIPVVLDPVGAGASALRNGAVEKLLSQVKFTVVRGNLSEMSFIAGAGCSTRGVDVSDSDCVNNAFEIAKMVASSFRCVAAITGATDVIGDSTRMARIYNGVPQMSGITGTGCMLSGLCAAFAAFSDDPFTATVNAVSAMGIAGEEAKGRSEGSSSMRTALIDSLSEMTDGILEIRRKVIYEID